jgi:hypothetical protein
MHSIQPLPDKYKFHDATVNCEYYSADEPAQYVSTDIGEAVGVPTRGTVAG